MTKPTVRDLKLTKQFYAQVVGNGHFICRSCGMRVNDEREFHRELWTANACISVGPHNYNPSRPFVAPIVSRARTVERVEDEAQ